MAWFLSDSAGNGPPQIVFPENYFEDAEEAAAFTQEFQAAVTAHSVFPDPSYSMLQTIETVTQIYPPTD